MLVFIINQTAGNGKGLAYWRRFQKQLQEKEIPYAKYVSSSEADTRKFIAMKIKQQPIHAICVIGGDGTISSVIQEISGTQIPLAIYPAGSGNDTARMFQLTNDLTQFINKLHTSEIIQIDLLQVNDRFGITIAGVGIDTAIGEHVNQSFYKPIFNKLKIGSFSYIISAVKVAMSFPAFQSTITINGRTQTHEKTWVIACGNTASYGGGLTICPTANPTDGRLAITFFHSLPRCKAILRIFPTLLRGKQNNKPGISYTNGTDVMITTDRPISAILDGEVITQTPLHIQIQPKALQLILTM